MAGSRREGEREEEEGRRKEIGGAHRGKMVISRLGLTPLAQKVDGMAQR
jgi:hypothetical protein